MGVRSDLEDDDEGLRGQALLLPSPSSPDPPPSSPHLLCVVHVQMRAHRLTRLHVEAGGRHQGSASIVLLIIFGDKAFHCA